MLNVVLIVLTAFLLCNTVFLGVIAIGLRSARLKARQLESSVREFVSAPDDKTPSALAQTVDQIAQLVARAVVTQVQTTIMGIKSGEVRQAKAVERQEAMAKYPWLSILASMTPGLSKSLMKNPALLNLAGNALARAAAPGPTGGVGTEAGVSRPAAAPVPSNGRRNQAVFQFGGGD